MIKFFRKIRYDLMETGKIGKYLKYAIGEILLVVIGILIALQINNWNERRRENLEEQRILSLLTKDLEKDIASLLALKESAEKRFKEMDTLMLTLSSEDNYDIPKFLQLGISSLGFEGYFKSNTGTYDESVAAGSIKFISNDSLRQKIFTYYGDVKLNYTDKNNQKQVYEKIYPVFFKKLMATKNAMQLYGVHNRLAEIDLQSLGQDPEFMAMLIQKKASETFQVYDWQIFLDLANDLNESITQEINND